MVETKERGVSGTVNWDGYLQTENNPALEREAGYGRLQDWGQYEELRRTNADATVAMEMTVAPIRDASIEVEPADESAEAQKIADFVRDNLQHWMAPKWGGLAEQIVDTFLTFGFNIHEPIHGVRADARVPGGQAYFVRKMAHRLPASLTQNPWVEKDGELVAIRQQGYVNGQFTTRELPADKLLLFTWKQSGTNWAGYSAFRAAWYLWRIQKECIKAFGIGTTRESLGVPVVSNVEGKGDDTKIEDLRKFVANLVMHENASAVLPPGFKLDWLFSPGANKSHIMDGIDRLGSKIKELLFAHGTGLGITSEGNRSVGETHEDIRGLFIAGLIRLVTDVVNGVEGERHTGLVRRIVEPNWGPQARYPTVKLVLRQGDIPVDQYATGVTQLITAGAILWTEADEQYSRERFGLKPIDPKVREQLVAEKAAAAAAIAGAKQDKFGGAKPKDDDEDEEKPRNVKASAALPFQLRRQPRMSERFIAAAEIDGFLNVARTDFERDARDIVEDMVRRALPALKTALADGDPSDVSEVKLDSTGLRAYSDGFVEKARRYGAKTVRAERKRSQAEELLQKRRIGDQTLAPTPLAAAAEAEEEEDDKKPVDSIDRHEVEQRVEKLVKAQTNLVTNRITNRVRMELEREAIDLVNRGGQVEDIVDRVADSLANSKALRNDAGLVLTRTFNLGREEAAAEFAEEVAHVEYSALLDGQQCIACERDDGKTAEFGSPEHDALVPPNRDCAGGPNCRCIAVFVFKTPGFRKEAA